jgi:hypothetical protein
LLFITIATTATKPQGTYKINLETLHFERTDSIEDSLTHPRVTSASPWQYQFYSATFADPRQPMAVALGEENNSRENLIGPRSQPHGQRCTYSLDRAPKPKNPYSPCRTVRIQQLKWMNAKQSILEKKTVVG